MGTLTLGLRRAERDLHRSGNATTALRKDGLTQSPVAYADFEVDEQRLHSRLEKWWDRPLDVVTELRDDAPSWAIESLERLLGDRGGDLPDGRASLYVCPEDGSLGCGAITALVEVTADEVTWRELGWQRDYEPDIDLVLNDGQPLSLTFARRQYEAVLRTELDRYQALRTAAENVRLQEKMVRRSALRDRVAWLLKRR